MPVLPAGMWESLHGNNQNSNNAGDSAAELEAFLSRDSEEVMPSGFGRGGRGGGRMGGRGRISEGRGRGRIIEKDLKGKDWECPSCANINWSWRSSCNKCNASKPAVSS